MIRLLPSCLLLGCVGITPVRLHGDVAPAELDDAIDGIAIASVLVPLEVVDEDRLHDAHLHVVLTRDGRFPGEVIALDGCNRVVLAVPAPMIVAHELGHLLLGPEHHSDRYNLMADGGPLRDDVTDAQIRKARRTARRLDRCR